MEGRVYNGRRTSEISTASSSAGASDKRTQQEVKLTGPDIEARDFQISGPPCWVFLSNAMCVPTLGLGNFLKRHLGWIG